MRIVTAAFMASVMCFGMLATGVSAQDNEIDFDALLGGIDEPAAKQPAETPAAQEAVSQDIDLDALLGGDEPATEMGTDPLGDLLATPAEPVAEAVEAAPEEVGTERAALPALEVIEPTLPEDPVEAARVLAERESVARRTRELTGLKQLEQGYNLLREGEFAKAMDSFEKSLANIPERGETDDDRMKASWGLAEANFRIAERALDRGDVAEAEVKNQTALNYDPTFKSALKLSKDIDKAKARKPKPPKATDDEEIITKNEQVAYWLDQGRQYYELGEWKIAEGFYERALLKDEFNSDAIRYLKRINERKFEVRSEEMWATKSRMIEDVRNSWNPPIRVPEDLRRTPVGPGKETSITSDVRVLEEKMENILIPRIEFRSANIQDVISFLVDASIANDPEGIGVNVILNLNVAGDDAGAGGGAQEQDPFATDPFAADPFAADPFAADAFGATPGGGANTMNEPATTVGGGSSGNAVPNITLNLRRVSMLDAVRYVTEVAGLKYRIEKKVVIITPADSVQGQVVTKIYPVQPSIMDMIIEKETTDNQDRGEGEFIEMGRATTMTRGDVKKFFTDAGVPFPRGTSITFNAAISSLIVANTSENMAIFERILSQINVIPKQVEIEARFTEVIQSDLKELGLEWMINDDIELFEKEGNGPIATKERVQIDANTAGVTGANRYFGQGESGLAPAYRNAEGLPNFAGSIFSLSSVLTNPELQVILHAIDQSGNSDVLSAPRVTTRNGVNAQIEVVEEIIYPSEFTSEATGSGGGVVSIPQDFEGQLGGGNIVIYPSSFETREVGVILNVTPTVGPDGYTIELTLAPEVAELVDWVQYGTPPYNIPQPIFASRNVTTSINIWDGQTVVMGGLIKEELVTIDDKVPLLGDIPLLGALFSNKGEGSRKANLLIFVTARVVDPAGNPIRKTSDLEVVEGMMSAEDSLTQ